MMGRCSVAIGFLGAACATLAGGCGVSQDGLAAGAASGMDAQDRADSGVGEDGARPWEDGSQADDAREADPPGDAPQGDATLSDDGPSAADADGGPLDEAAGPPDGEGDALPLLDAAGDTKPIGDGGISADGGVDAGPDVSGGPDAAIDGHVVDGGNEGGTVRDAGATCGFAGTWASRIDIDVTWTPQGLTGIILASGSGTIMQWLLSTRTLNGSSCTESAVLCGIGLPDFDGTAIAGGEVYGIRYPNWAFDGAYAPTFTIQGTFSGTSPNSTYNTSPNAVLLGLKLANPTTAPWPATITTEVDSDHDGKPGVTAYALQGNGYTYPPVDLFKTNRAQEVYLAIRQVTQMSAQATDCDHLSGTVAIATISDPKTGTSKPAIDSHVIGCEVSGTTNNCDSTQAAFVDNTQPVFTPNGGSAFTSVRVAAGSTCPQVRQALP